MHSTKVGHKLQAVTRLAGNRAAMSYTQPDRLPNHQQRVSIAKPVQSPQLSLDPSEDCTVQGQASVE